MGAGYIPFFTPLVNADLLIAVCLKTSGHLKNIIIYASCWVGVANDGNSLKTVSKSGAMINAPLPFFMKHL